MFDKGLAFLAALAAVLAFCDSSPAQRFGSPTARRAPGAPGVPGSPTTSPYLNLLGRGSVAQNYYTLVRPEIERRALVQQQFNSLRNLSSQVRTLQSRRDGPIRATGHGTMFLNLSHYYPTYRRGR